MTTTTTVSPSPYRGCLLCDTCGAHFDPTSTISVAYDLTMMGGSIVGPITRRPGQCLGCGREYR